MKFLSLLLPAVLVSLAAQAQTAPVKKVADTKGPAPVAMKNFKESGSPSAKVQIEIYTDYECPACRELYLNVLPILNREYVQTGKVHLLHRDFPLQQHKYSRIATRYANAAGSIGKYDLVAQQIFQTQPEWSQNGNMDVVLAKVLSPGDLAKIREMAMSSDTKMDDTVLADVAMGNSDRLAQTPTIVIVAKGKRDVIGGAPPWTVLKSSTKSWRNSLPAELREMKRGLLIAGRLIVAGIFLYAGIEKLRQPWLQFVISIEGFKIVPDNLLEPMARTLPWLEVAAGLGLLINILAPWAALATALMLTVFNTAGIWAYAKGLQVDCGCFGAGGDADKIGPLWFAEHGAMLLLAIAVTVGAFLLRNGTAAAPQTSEPEKHTAGVIA